VLKGEGAQFGAVVSKEFLIREPEAKIIYWIVITEREVLKEEGHRKRFGGLDRKVPSIIRSFEQPRVGIEFIESCKGYHRKTFRY